MTTLTTIEARARLYNLLDEVALSHQSIQITGKMSKSDVLFLVIRSLSDKTVKKAKTGLIDNQQIVL